MFRSTCPSDHLEVGRIAGYSGEQAKEFGPGKTSDTTANESVNLLFGGVGELVFAPSIVALSYTGIAPEALDGNYVRLLQSGYIFEIDCFY